MYFLYSTIKEFFNQISNHEHPYLFLARTDTYYSSDKNGPIEIRYTILDAQDKRFYVAVNKDGIWQESLTQCYPHPSGLTFTITDYLGDEGEFIAEIMGDYFIFAQQKKNKEHINLDLNKPFIGVANQWR